MYPQMKKPVGMLVSRINSFKSVNSSKFLGNFITTILPCCCFLFFFQIIAIFHAVAMNWNILKFYLYYWILKCIYKIISTCFVENVGYSYFSRVKIQISQESTWQEKSGNLISENCAKRFLNDIFKLQIILNRCCRTPRKKATLVSDTYEY